MSDIGDVLMGDLNLNSVAYFMLPVEDAKVLNRLIKLRLENNSPNASEGKVADNFPSPQWEKEMQDAMVRHREVLDIYVFIERIGGLIDNYVKYDFDSEDSNQIKYLLCSSDDKCLFFNTLHHVSDDRFQRLCNLQKRGCNQLN